jgi:hypothetical protein
MSCEVAGRSGVGGTTLSAHAGVNGAAVIPMDNTPAPAIRVANVLFERCISSPFLSETRHEAIGV